MGSPLLLLLAWLIAVTKAKPFLPICHCPHGRQPWHSLSAFCPCPGLCMAFYQSTLNTAAHSIKADSSANYGIFQISSQQWCTDDHSPSDNRCRVACRDLLSSSITDDIICAKRIVRNPQGMDAW
ncbi:lysozyme C, milk isozyme [Pelecanus crispus]|uniref:lysozyme C, milk isozyme n=1 Tax=Pelecanus crispus TaxID=36300 RepID=UPI003F5D1767